MNKVILVGNLTRDPEYGTTQSGVNYCRFTVACQRRFTNQQGVREADFINCVAWRQTADFVNNWFRKGNRIGLEGSIQVRSYDDQSGQKRWATEVIVNEVEFAGSKSDGGNNQSAYGDPGPTPPPQGQHNGNIPGIMQPPRNQQQPANRQMNMNDFQEVEDDELPF